MKMTMGKAASAAGFMSGVVDVSAAKTMPVPAMSVSTESVSTESSG